MSKQTELSPPVRCTSCLDAVFSLCPGSVIVSLLSHVYRVSNMCVHVAADSRIVRGQSKQPNQQALPDQVRADRPFLVCCAKHMGIMTLGLASTTAHRTCHDRNLQRNTVALHLRHPLGGVPIPPDRQNSELELNSLADPFSWLSGSHRSERGPTNWRGKGSCWEACSGVPGSRSANQSSWLATPTRSCQMVHSSSSVHRPQNKSLQG
jgi:hypothetical protein